MSQLAKRAALASLATQAEARACAQLHRDEACSGACLVTSWGVTSTSLHTMPACAVCYEAALKFGQGEIELQWAFKQHYLAAAPMAGCRYEAPYLLNKEMYASFMVPLSKLVAVSFNVPLNGDEFPSITKWLEQTPNQLLPAKLPSPNHNAQEETALLNALKGL